MDSFFATLVDSLVGGFITLFVQLILGMIFGTTA